MFIILNLIAGIKTIKEKNILSYANYGVIILVAGEKQRGKVRWLSLILAWIIIVVGCIKIWLKFYWRIINFLWLLLSSQQKQDQIVVGAVVMSKGFPKLLMSVNYM